LPRASFPRFHLIASAIFVDMDGRFGSQCMSAEQIFMIYHFNLEIDFLEQIRFLGEHGEVLFY